MVKQQTGKAGECSKDSSVKGDNIMIRYGRLQRLRWGEVYHLDCMKAYYHMGSGTLLNVAVNYCVVLLLMF